jgi:Domain of unknown function (DUF4234)
LVAVTSAVRTPVSPGFVGCRVAILHWYTNEYFGVIAVRNVGPRGQTRGIGFGILLFVVTLGFYAWYWAFKTQEEMKQHSGEGLGGVLGLVIWVIVHPVSAFVIPSEIGRMYVKGGKQPPMTGWTGLWLFPGEVLLIPAIVWFVKVQGGLNRYWEEAPSAPTASSEPAPAPTDMSADQP